MIFLWTSIPLRTALMQLLPLAVSCDLQTIKDQEKNIPLPAVRSGKGFLKNYKLVLSDSILEQREKSFHLGSKFDLK